MMPYLIEPYNAWDKTPKKKKHLCQVIEEEALMARIIAEQQSAQQQIRQSVLLPVQPSRQPALEQAFWFYLAYCFRGEFPLPCPFVLNY